MTTFVLLFQLYLQSGKYVRKCSQKTPFCFRYRTWQISEIKLSIKQKHMIYIMCSSYKSKSFSQLPTPLKLNYYHNTHICIYPLNKASSSIWWSIMFFEKSWLLSLNILIF